MPLLKNVVCVLAAIFLATAPAYVQDSRYVELCQEKSEKFGSSYINARYGYILNYEGGWHKLEIGGNEHPFNLYCDEQPVVYARVVDMSRYDDFEQAESKTDSLEFAATRYAAMGCAAGGPGGSAHCERAQDVAWFRSEQGRLVLKFSQTLVETHYNRDSNEEEEERKRIGPYYAIDISQDGVGRLLLLEGRFSESPAWANMLKNIARQIEIVESPFLRK